MLSRAQGVQEGPRVKRRRVEAQEGGVGRGLHTHARTRTHTRSHIYIHTHTHTMAASRRRTEEALSQKGGRQNMYYKKPGNERSEPRDNPEVVPQFTCFHGIKVQILTHWVCRGTPLHGRVKCATQHLSLLALLVQKYKC
jgi:hypothetical protein